MVTGSVACIVYGEPRLTHDVDIVLILDAQAIERFPKLFPDEEFYCPPVEVLRVEARRRQRGHFNLIEHRSGFKADVYVAGEDELHRWAMAHRRTIDVEGKPLQLAPPEYVIARKLEYYREGKSDKHLRDIRGVLRHSRGEIDFTRLEEMVALLGVQNEWRLAALDGAP